MIDAPKYTEIKAEQQYDKFVVKKYTLSLYSYLLVRSGIFLELTRSGHFFIRK